MTATLPASPELTDEARKIVTDFVHPPIPVRQFDWCAYIDGTEEGGTYGWGETEQAAIRDLRFNLGEECWFCKKPAPISCAVGGCPYGGDQ